jgi:hypothetical protein
LFRQHISWIGTALLGQFQPQTQQTGFASRKYSPWGKEERRVKEVGKESGRGVKGEKKERERRAKGEGKQSEKREWKKRESRGKGE